MHKISVNTERKYDVIVSSGILTESGKIISQTLHSSRCVVVTDDIVDLYYSEILISALNLSGIECSKFVVPHGELSKSPENFISLLGFLADFHITRSDCVISCGGGVVGDLAGFAASCYMRGCKLVHIPTTLLSMVDSSIGGKTGINLSSGKNLCGSFYQPHLVLCDTDLLSTLPEDIFLDGCAEIIKYSCISGPSLFNYLKNQGKDFSINYVIPLCISTKADIVSSDSFDIGERRLLNLGHTLAHAIEKASSYCVSHGNAVAMGISIITDCAFHSKLCSKDVRDDIINLLEDFGFNLHHGFEIQELLPYILSDKKSDDSGLSLVIPYDRGYSRIIKIEYNNLPEFLRYGVVLWK